MRPTGSLRRVSTQAPAPRMPADQRRIVWAVAISAVMVFTVSAGFNYVLSAILDDFDASQSEASILRQVPSIGALLVVFAAGVLGQRLGARRVMLVCAGLYTLGSVVVACAPWIEVVTLGLLIDYVGKSALVVVALAYMSASIVDKNFRASAFATYTAATPVAYLVIPVLTGLLVQSVGWRWVAVVWAISGLLALSAVWFLVPRTSAPDKGSREMVTPLLAGAVLAAAVQVLTELTSGATAARLWLSLLVLAVALGALVIAMRRIPEPSLSLLPLRDRQLVLLLVVLMLTVFTNLWFYTTMALQYIFGLEELDVAVAMLPAQILSIVAAGFAGKAVGRFGITASGTGMLLAVAACLVASAQVQLTTPLWVVIAIVSGYSAAAIGVSIAMTNAIMDTATRDEQGLTSSYRSAASNMGSAVGVAVMTAIIITAVSISVQDQSAAQGVSTETAEQATESVKQGATAGDLSAEYAVPLPQADQLDAISRQAFMVGYQTHGWAGAVVILLGTCLFYGVRRRAGRNSVAPT